MVMIVSPVDDWNALIFNDHTVWDLAIMIYWSFGI
jgi:hypothetical protein